MVQKIHPRGVIWVPSIHPQADHFSEKNDNLAVQYKNVHAKPYFQKIMKIKNTYQNVLLSIVYLA